MHPDLDEFLERVLAPIEPVSKSIGRVVVEPDYDTEPDDRDADSLRTELTACIAALPAVSEPITSPHGREVKIDTRYSVLGKYLRHITLHRDTVEGAWVEVAPPGNWI